MTAPPSAFASAADVTSLLVLLCVMAMLRAPFVRSQVRIYRFQSLAVTALVIVIASTHHLDGLYALAAISFATKVVVVPEIMARLAPSLDADLSSSARLKTASMLLLAGGASAFGFFAIGALHLPVRTLPGPALSIAVASLLISFLLVILRSDVLSQGIAFFSLENSVSVASLVVATALPVIMEIAFLFDLLVAVVAFGLLMRVHHRRAKTLSTEQITRLRG
ncbi:MAG: hydrogenase [Acidimicrobiales bacterium]|jgi:hydrogenase-4 component E